MRPSIHIATGTKGISNDPETQHLMNDTLGHVRRMKVFENIAGYDSIVPLSAHLTRRWFKPSKV